MKGTQNTGYKINNFMNNKTLHTLLCARGSGESFLKPLCSIHTMEVSQPSTVKSSETQEAPPGKAQPPLPPSTLFPDSWHNAKHTKCLVIMFALTND